MDSDNKPRLSDVMAAIVSSVTHARKVADMEALRIARRYHRDELLQGLPVPRLRFNRVAIDLPVILSEVIPGAPAQMNDPDVIARVAVAAMHEELERVGHDLRALGERPLRPAEADRIEQALKVVHRLQYWKRALEVTAPVGESQREEQQKARDEANREARAGSERRLAEKLTRALHDLTSDQMGTPPSDAAVMEAIGDAVEADFRSHVTKLVYRIEGEEAELAKQSDPQRTFSLDEADRAVARALEDTQIRQVLDAARRAAEAAATSAPSVAPDFRVSVTTDDIKNSGGGPSTVTRLHLVLLEEGLEWVSQGEAGGETKWALSKE